MEASKQTGKKAETQCSAIAIFFSYSQEEKPARCIKEAWMRAKVEERANGKGDFQIITAGGESKGKLRKE